MSLLNEQGITPTDLDRLAKLVEARLGIRTEAGDLRAVLTERLAATGAACASSYLDHLDNHQAAKEWSALAIHLTVPETYFFRNTGHWTAFAEFVIPAIIGKQGAQDAPLRIWSAACSTGEEPYTIAMALAEMNLSKLVGAGSILATDLLEESLATAKKATYRSNSFRGVTNERIDRYFHRDGDLHTVGSEFRESVTFRQLNLADATAVDAFIAREGPFQIIFCRNVLIYFAPEVCSKLLDQFADALTPDGTLFLGHSEFPHMWTDSLESIQVDNTFLWRKKSGLREPRSANEGRGDASASKDSVVMFPTHTGLLCAPVALSLSDRTTLKPRESMVTALTGGCVVSEPEPSVRARDRGNKPQPGALEVEGLGHWSRVDKVFEHLQAGRSDEAFSTSRQLIADNDLSPGAHFMLGLVLERAGDTAGAVNSYGRAVFLDHTFAQAHWRLAQVMGVWKLSDRAIAEARWAVRTVGGESDERISHLSDVGRQTLTIMMEQTLGWLLTQQESKKTFACATS